MSRDESRKSRLAGPLSKKIKFTKTEDMKLKELIEKYSTNDWKKIAKHMQPRTARQCRERWCNYIDPNLSHEPWTSEEDEILLKIHEQIGNHWKKMEEFLPNRSKNNIKKRWCYLTNTLSDDNNTLNQSQSAPEIQPVEPEKTIVTPSSSLYLTTPGFSQISKPEMIPIVQPATIVPLVPVLVSINTPIISLAGDLQNYTQKIQSVCPEYIEQPTTTYIQPVYQTGIYQMLGENYY